MFSFVRKVGVPKPSRNHPPGAEISISPEVRSVA